MRGYSVHDLYAKALALLGLGVLAGAGALVDYWPSSSNLPSPVNARVSLPGEGVASAALSGPDRIDVAPSRATVRPRAVVARAAVLTTDAAIALPVLVPVLMSSEALGTSVPIRSLASHPMPVVIDEPIFADAPVAVPAEPSDPVYALVDNPGAPVARALDEDDAGLITGAFRRTGTSLRKTGIKTGSSIVGAIRGFGGVVRRALPVL